MDESKPSLADDPGFLASLDALDRGLGKPRPAPPAPAPLRTNERARAAAIDIVHELERLATGAAATRPPAATPPQPSAPTSSQTMPGRPLLDLFPPARPTSPGALAAAPSGAAAPSVPPPTTPPSERSTLGDRLGLPSPSAPAYETFYGFAEQPFGLTPDPKFLYPGTSHDRAVEQLIDAVGRRHGIVTLLVGAAGVGRTTVCRAVLEHIESGTAKLLLDGNSLTSGDLQTRLAAVVTSPAPPVVIVDDADRARGDVLQQLATIMESTGGSLRLLLVGEPALADVLARPALAPLARRVSLRVELAPLEPDEIAGYVRHRMLVAGSTGRVDFGENALRRIYEYSGGVPRVINMLCDRALEDGWGASASVIDADLIESAADALALDAVESDAPPAAQLTVLVAILISLMLVGAAGAAIVFHDRLAQLFDHLR